MWCRNGSAVPLVTCLAPAHLVEAHWVFEPPQLRLAAVCDQEALAKFVATGEDTEGYGLPDILLNELCRRGLIEPGRYLIEVSW